MISEIRAYGVSDAEAKQFGGLIISPMNGQPIDLGTRDARNKFVNSLPYNPKEPLDQPINPKINVPIIQ